MNKFLIDFHIDGSQLIVQLNNTQKILSIVSPGGSVFALTYENSNEMHIYSWTAATANPPSLFYLFIYLFSSSLFIYYFFIDKFLRTLRIFEGEIKCVGADYYNRLWAYDAGCSCVKVFDQFGTLIYMNLLFIVILKQVQEASFSPHKSLKLSILETFKLQETKFSFWMILELFAMTSNVSTITFNV